MQEWIKPVGNHLFWCSQNSGDDGEKLIQMWQSLLFHVTNRHTFEKSYPKYRRCSHERYTKSESREKKWIENNSPAYNNLEKVILDARNLKDMPKLTKTYHTGNLEVFHSLINSYAPKRQEFELNVMDARVKLAVLDHNNNVGRKQAKIKVQRTGSGKVGENKWRFVSSKLSKEWVAKPIMDPKSYEFIDKIIEEIVERKVQGQDIKTKSSELTNRLKSPKNIAYTERPEISSILAKHDAIKRFK